MRIHQDGQFGLTQHVNESRSHDHLLGIDGPPTHGITESSDSGDAAVADAHVRAVPRRARAIDDVAVSDDHIIVLRTRRRRDDRQQRK